MIRLSELSVGDHARVTNIEGTDAISRRLMEMGLIQGVAVARVGTAPLGDPLEFELRGYRLSLRRTEADRVAVDVD